MVEDGTLGRFSISLNLEKPSGPNRVVLHSYAGTISSSGAVPYQHLFFLGGPVTAPGYDFHSLTGSSALSQRFEFRFPVSVPSMTLGRYGRTPAAATLAPYFNVAGISGTKTLHSLPMPAGWYPSVGLALLPMFDLMRFDVARGLHNGRWTFSFDITRDLWSIL
jgi:hypothetical protein